MKPNLPFVPCILHLALGCWLALGAQAAESDDATLSPYFFIENGDLSLDQLPLKSTEVDVSITGVIADVEVRQVYANTGQRPIEAKYVFPGSTRAAVHGMRMTIGERVIVAEIEEKQEAKRIYDQAKEAGKSASLLQQRRPNVFEMNVANIMPGDEIAVTLNYTEMIEPEDNVYSFVYPGVVGPRYSNTPLNEAEPAEAWVQNPYLTPGRPLPAAFDIKVKLQAPFSLNDVRCGTHEINADFQSESSCAVSLQPGIGDSGNRDFILNYRLAGATIQSGLMVHEGEHENFFMLILEPPAEIAPGMLPPRDYVFIIDVSGSMNGFPLNTTKRLMRDLLGSLRPEDTFNVLLFAGGSTVYSEQPVPATAGNIAEAIAVVDSYRGSGGTELLPALQRALRLPKTEHGSRNIVIATDGYVSVERRAFGLIEDHLGEANVFAFGIGSSINRYLIEGMARAGGGEAFVVTKPGEAEAQAARFRRYIDSPVLTNIGVTFDGFKAYDIEPKTWPDLFARRPLVIQGKWRGALDGDVTITGFTGETRYRHEIDLGALAPSSEAALPLLWARSRIARLSDYNRVWEDADNKQAVTNLGLTYNLMTEYTSFVAVDEVVRNESGESETVTQPLPLPKGVSNLAVGKAGVTPEPRAIWVTVLAGALVAGYLFVTRRRTQIARG